MEKSVVNEIKDIINMNVLNDLLDIDFRGIGKQAMIKRLRKHFLENPEEKDQNKWKVSAEKIWKLYPNALQFKNEKGKCLDVVANGGVIIWTCHSGNHQKFKLYPSMHLFIY